MLPHKGPYEQYFEDPEERVVLKLGEQAAVLAIRVISAFEWLTVVARFVNVYNNLDPDAAEFKNTWDLLNRFITYFKVQRADAKEMRRYFIERADEARAKARMRVMNDFSPHLAEKFVWKLNKAWLMKVPCFSLVVERLVTRPESGMERFLVKVALTMQPAVYVPMECPPPRRLYIVTEGRCRVRRNVIGVGDSWGAEDVMLSGPILGNFKAQAESYLHVLWIGADKLEEIGKEHRDAYLLVKMWATVFAAGTRIVEFYRQEVKHPFAIQVGHREAQIPPAVMEQRINEGKVSVVQMTNENGEVLKNSYGEVFYTFKQRCFSHTGYDILKETAKVTTADGKQRKVHKYRMIAQVRRASQGEAPARRDWAEAIDRLTAANEATAAAPSSESAMTPIQKEVRSVVQQTMAEETRLMLEMRQEMRQQFSELRDQMHLIRKRLDSGAQTDMTSTFPAPQRLPGRIEPQHLEA